MPIVIGIREASLEEALREETPICENIEKSVRIQIETDDMDAGMIQDMPVSFGPNRRIYGYRKIKEFFVELHRNDTEHDAMSELE